MDRFWYEATFYITILSLVIALTVACTWPRRRGKALLCSYLIVSLLAPLPGYVLGVLLRHGTIDWESLPTQTIHAIGAVLSIVIAGLLLVFVIVARRQDGDEMPAPTGVKPKAKIDEQTPLY